MNFTKPLKGRFLFKLMFKKAKYISNKNITVYILKDYNNTDENKLGICVSKKHGNSVVRNKLKRWAREAYKELESDLNKGYYIIVLYKKSIDIKNINYSEVKKELGECFEKYEFYRKNK